MSTNVLAIVSDLFFVVKIGDAAKRAGLNVHFTSDCAVAVEKAREGPCLILIDLNNDRAQPIDLVRTLKATAETKDIPVVGYLSHVHVELKKKAEEAGCDRVLARSALADQLNHVFAPRVPGRV
jgi:CheY-like chemotaxis protein